MLRKNAIRGYRKEGESRTWKLSVEFACAEEGSLPRQKVRFVVKKKEEDSSRRLESTKWVLGFPPVGEILV
jgi:hypothetical protein